MFKILNSNKKCQQCGSTEGVREATVSSFTGERQIKYLCLTCARKEQLKKY